MKVLVVSDTHGRESVLADVREAEGQVDLVIHLGDIEGGAYLLDALFDCAKHVVRGNNDFFSDLPAEKVIRMGPYKAFLTHGNQYRVSMGTKWLAREGVARGVDMVLFGHTHRPFREQVEGVLLLNPGSLGYPRQEGRRPAYLILEIGEDGSLDIQQKFL